MTEAEKREASRQIYNKWKNKGKEDEDDRSFWLDILTRLFGVPDATDKIEFQKKVYSADGTTNRIDCYIPETKVLIEQKSRGIALDKPQPGHQGKTPFQQAKDYDNGLPHDEKSKWIILSNFGEIWIYDMDEKKPDPVKISLDELQNKYTLLEFLISEEVKKVNREMELSLEAGKLVGKIHDRFLEQYNDPMAKRTQNSLNILCVRLVFCLYAEDAGLFGAKDAFSAYLNQYDPKDMRRALLDLFKVLDTPLDQRAELYLDDELEAFPYVNGGLFARENIEIPKLTQEIKDILLESAAFDWSEISPTIFGAVFESTLNPETRRSGGMHYTSIENIHKVIDPLFLDDLKAELQQIRAVKVEKTRDKQLRAFQDKLASLKWLDPACGSGNFLTETYMSVRRLENEVLGDLQHGQIMFGFEAANPIKVGIDQFYGIEINDFAVTVAKTALWIAESQMMKETEDVVHMDLDFLPLRTNAYIVEGNALRLDWNKIAPKSELSYIMGNPPFVGFKFANISQKEDMKAVFCKEIKPALLDYVCCWYKKASEYIQNSKCKVAFVSTNSVTQGQMAGDLWSLLLEKYQIEIQFAWRSFVWENDSNNSASVHVVIVGFSLKTEKKKKLYDGDNLIYTDNISPYLITAPNVLILSRRLPLCDIPKIMMGNQAMDGGNLIIEDKEYPEFIKKEPKAIPYIKRYMMGYEFINNKKRWCLWLVGCSPTDLRSMPEVLKRVEAVQKMRASSNDAGARKKAETPTLFREQRNPEHFIAIPIVSSERRRYIPMGYLGSDVIAGNKLFIIPDASLYHFGILNSNVHMSWMRTVAARLKSDYTYSKDIVYNNFPWPSPTEDQKQKIEETAQAILDARALYPDSSLADLYDPLTMPPELRKAHQKNDAAVMKAYGFSVKDMTEADCVAALMKLYQELVEAEQCKKK